MRLFSYSSVKDYLRHKMEIFTLANYFHLPENQNFMEKFEFFNNGVIYIST